MEKVSGEGEDDEGEDEGEDCEDVESEDGGEGEDGVEGEDDEKSCVKRNGSQQQGLSSSLSGFQ